MSQPIIKPVFNIDLGVKIVPGRVTVGKYDGCHSCLTVATTADKVVIHSPHRRSQVPSAGRVIWSESNKELAILNMNQAITSILAGQLIPDETKDILVVGTPTHILVYNVFDNRDIFYKECEDGALAFAIGKVRDKLDPQLLVGGGSTVRALDHTGTELWWTAVGDKVTDLALVDFNNDGFNEIVVSSEDYMIRVYKDDRLISEQTETEMVTGLAELPDNRYAYSVSNGTIGVYEQDTRLWRVKSKNFVISMYCYDLIGQGSKQLVTGWSNGKIDCRSILTGEVLFKDTLAHGAAGVVEADYRSLGKTDLVCVSVEGEVKGYSTTKLIPNMVPGSNPEQDTVRELLQQKQSLLLELKHYENNTRYNEENLSPRFDENVGIIPANTRLQIGVSTNEDKQPQVEISVATNNDTIIKAVMVFAEGIFKGEAHVVHPPEHKLSNHLIVPIEPPKDIPVDIHIKAFVGYKSSKQFHVFELTRQLPRFSMYCVSKKLLEKTSSYVEFKITERIQRICMWVNQNFLLDNDIEPPVDSNFKLSLICLRDGSNLGIYMDITGKVVIYTRNMLLASDIVRSLANFLNLENLQSIASFPEDETKLKEYMESLKDIQDARLRLTTDVADRIGQIRGLIVKAEDSRINAIHEISQHYTELYSLNQELMNGYNIRLANYTEGVETLKAINGIIQKASRFRVGKPAADLINNCRTAIKKNNIESLVKIIRTGQI